jgi:hypothetical protein
VRPHDEDPGWPKDITCAEMFLVLGAVLTVVWIVGTVVFEALI